MSAAADGVLPETYDQWPPDIQLRYITELYALYFPEHVHQADDSTDPPQPAGTATDTG